MHFGILFFFLFFEDPLMHRNHSGRYNAHGETRGGARGKLLGGQRNLGGQGGSAKPPEAEAFLVLKSWQKPFQSMYFLVKDDRKLILITLMHENTPYYFLFPPFEIFLGAFAPPCPPMAPPLHG